MSEDYVTRFEVHRPGHAPVAFYRSEDAWQLFDSLVSSDSDTPSAEIIQTTRVRIASFKRGTDHGTQPAQ